MKTKAEDVDEDAFDDKACNISTSAVVDRNEFNQKLCKIAKKHGVNTKLIPQDRYQQLISHIKRINEHGKKASIDFRRDKRYAMVKMPNGEERLFYKPAIAVNKRLMMVTLEETYDIIQKYHVTLTNHGGRSRMMDKIKKKYYNVTAECLLLYLSMCRDCKAIRAFAMKKQRQQAKRQATIQKANESPSDSLNDDDGDPLDNSVAPEIEKNEVLMSETTQKYPELYSRAQMDLLSVTNEPSEEYKYMMVYRNYTTKYIHLKAMAGISVEEAAEALLEIFLVFGAPNILQSKNGVAILKPICRRIFALYPDVKVVYSDNNFSTTAFPGKSNEDILRKLNAWLVVTQNTKWQNGVKYIQNSLNTAFNETIYRSPSELVFGKNPSKGICSFLNNTENVFSEFDLLTALDSKNEQDGKVKNNLLLTESLIMPNELIKLEVAIMSDEENVEELY